MKTKDSPIRRYIQRRKPRGLGGRSPQSLRWGDSPCIRPPNILRSSVVGCARKYAKSKKRCFCCEERVMYEVSCMIFNKVRSGKSVKIRKTWSMTKKGHQKFLPLKSKFFQKKIITLIGEKYDRPLKLSARFPPLCMYVCVYVCMHVCMHVYVCVCMYAYELETG